MNAYGCYSEVMVHFEANAIIGDMASYNDMFCSSLLLNASYLVHQEYEITLNRSF